MIIFLDIDGVMVPARYQKMDAISGDGFANFSEEAIEALNSLIKEDTQVILTTAHKSNYSIEEWKGIFKRRGIEINNLNRLDYNTEMLNRCDEVLKWFDSNGIPEDFIIIDDDKSLNALPAFLKKKLILVSPLIGLRMVYINRI